MIEQSMEISISNTLMYTRLQLALFDGMGIQVKVRNKEVKSVMLCKY